MKNVTIKYSFFCILLVIVSCKTITNKTVKNNSTKDSITKKFDYSNIEINSINDDFDFNLINTLPAKEAIPFYFVNGEL